MTINSPFVQANCIEITDRLPILKGCFAQVYLAVGIFEADPLGLSVKDLSRLLGLARPSVSKACDFLEEKEMIQGIKDERGTVRYRACFGFTYRGTAQVDLREDVNKLFTSQEEEKKVLVPVSVQNKPSPSSKPVPVPETRNVLKSAGLYGRDLDTLAGTVALDVADRWARWIAWAKAETRFDSPAGIARYRLLIDPTAAPDNWREVELWERDSAMSAEMDDAPVDEGIDTPMSIQAAPSNADERAGAVWHTVLGDLQLQMTKATFDQLLRPTRAILLDEANGFILVHVPSPYARESLENRLSTTIQRALTGTLGKSIQIRYISDGPAN